MSSSAELVTRTFDLTARVREVKNSLSQASTLAHGLIEIGQWLALERVDRTELYDCFSIARGLVYANHTGDAFYEKVVSSSISVKQAWPLAVKQSGALGRIIVKDPHLAWLASTTACLMQFHDDRVISDALCILLLRSDPGYSNRPDYELRYLANRVELKSTVDKIIGSIWFNVVNPGQKTNGLPPELQEICEHGHRLSGDQIGSIIHILKDHRDKIVIETLYFLEDLTVWLLLHFHGTLLVTVSGRIMFEKVLGGASRTIELKSRQFCSESEDCTKTENTLRVFSDVKGCLEEFMSGPCGTSVDIPSSPKTRKKLYDFVNAYDTIEAFLLPETIKVMVRQAAKAMLRWLRALNLTVPEDADYGFRISELDVTLGEMNGNSTRTTEGFRIGHLLGRSPSLMNMFGNALDGTIVYAPVQDQTQLASRDMADDESSSSDDIRKRKDETHSFEDEDLLQNLPILRDLVVAAKRNCNCDSCSEPHAKSQKYVGYTIPLGCLSEAAVRSVLILVAHAISEGFGSPDVSGNRDPQHILKACLAMLGEVIEEKKVRWDLWFNLAACVYLGCPFKPSIMDIKFGGTAYAAIQYGNLAVISPWLDITSKQEVERSFRMNRVEGKLGVFRDDDNNDRRFRGIMEKFAIIQTEHTEDVSSYTRKFEKWSEPLTGPLKLKLDDSVCDTEVVLVSAAEDVYRILLRIRSDTTLRVIDPVDTMIRLARSVPVLECPHKEDYLQQMTIHHNIKAYSFDDVLGHWQSMETFYGTSKMGMAGVFFDSKAREEERGLTHHLSYVLSNPAQVNVALALLVDKMALLNYGNCCLKCSVDKACTMPLLYNLDKDSTVLDRYIINVTSSTKKQIVTGTKRKYTT